MATDNCAGVLDSPAISDQFNQAALGFSYRSRGGPTRLALSHGPLLVQVGFVGPRSIDLGSQRAFFLAVELRGIDLFGPSVAFDVA